MSTTQKQKASVDDIVQQLIWLNENVGAFIQRHEEARAVMLQRQAYLQKHHSIERAISGVLCGVIFLLALGATGSQSASGNLAELTAQNVATTKTIIPSIIAIMAAIGVWRAIKSPPPSTH